MTAPGSAALLRSPLPLQGRTLARLGRRLSIPTYDRASLGRGVVHISVGSFHRAHQAVYFDDLARAGLGDGWALTGVGLHRREMKEVLEAQDGLYTVVARDGHGVSGRVVGVITRYLFAPEEDAAVLDALAEPATRLVTLTVTSSGYGVAAPGTPATAIDLIVEGLRRRKQRGLAPFTVLSCDNMPDNGRTTRTAVVSCAARVDERLARWIEDHAAFPSSMVDRITPGTTDADREMVEAVFGVRDRWPVVTEPFRQWVVEDSFCNGRPPLDEVGVRFVGDVAPYALMKTRLLNGSHLALAYLGARAGHATSVEVMADPVLRRCIERLMTDEIAPLLPPVDCDLDAYGATLRDRFGNPAICDRLSRLGRNGSAKVPMHLLSSIREARSEGRPHDLLTLTVAAWCRHLRDDHLDDADGARLQALARRGLGSLLADEATFGSLGRSPDFAAAVARDLRDLSTEPVRAVITARMAVEGRLAS